jgi:hypothetical protein
MIRIIQALILTVIFVFSSGAAWAQDGSGQKAPPKKKIKTMVDYQKELGLSDEQVAEVNASLVSFQETVTAQRAKLAQYEKEYKILLQNEAALADIKSKLRQIADTRFQIRYADVLTSRRVSNALTDEQMDKWREIQTKVRADQQPKKK